MAGALIDRVHEGFVATFGRDPDGVWSAPGRVSVAGDHTDLQDGVSYGFAIDLRTAVAVARRDDDAITVATDLTSERATARLATLQPGPELSDWKAYPLGMIWAVGAHAHELVDGGTDDDGAGVGAAAGRDATVATDGHAPPERHVAGTGLDIFLSTDLPVGGGLASSASVCAAIGIALRDLWSLDLSLGTIAELGHTTEVLAAGAATGIADHVTVLRATPDHDVFYDVRGRDASLIARPPIEADGLTSLIVGTRELHRNWSTAFRERQDACTRVAMTLDRQTLREVRLEELDAAARHLDPTDLRRARHVVTEVQRTLELTRVLRTGGAMHLGPLLAASQASLRDDFEVSTERIDDTCELALRHGAIGARMSGTGLGGSVFVLLPVDAQDAFVDAVTAHYRERGWDEPTVRLATASAGARRDA